MIPSAAPQHPDSKGLPMNPMSALASRAFAATRATLALVGFAAVAGYLLMPQLAQPQSWVAENTAAESAAGGASAPLQAAAESPPEQEQRAVTEYIAKPYP